MKKSALVLILLIVAAGLYAFSTGKQNTKVEEQIVTPVVSITEDRLSEQLYQELGSSVDEETTQTDAATPTSVPSEKPKPVTPTCPRPTNPEQANQWLSPVSTTYSVADYIPSDLVPLGEYINTKGRFICLTKPVAEVLDQMDQDAQKEGVYLVVNSGYRSASYQKKLKAEEPVREGQLYPSVAPAGHSEHQLGTTVDFTSGSMPAYTFDLFRLSKEYAWLVEHAHEYGFIQSYHKGDEPITGYIGEEWHWRYVGPERAQKVRDKEITLYEYLSKPESEKTPQQ